MRTRTLEEAVGGELKRLRKASGLRQEAIARVAQGFGLGWTQPTVAAIESGRRHLTLGELGMLPMIIVNAVGQLAIPGPPYIRLGRVLDLIPDTDEWVRVAPGQEAQLKQVRWLFGTLKERVAAMKEREGAVALYEMRRPEGVLFITEAERKVARALKTTPERVSRAAHTLWGHSLDEERDQRTGDAAATPQKRGRVTRRLLLELKRTIKGRNAAKRGRSNDGQGRDEAC
jgi:transcriptional regulator with XRE-family HTH domain